jgi:hypothetical protein
MIEFGDIKKMKTIEDLIGLEQQETELVYNKKDLIFYSTSIGEEDLKYGNYKNNLVYENNKNFSGKKFYLFF